MLKNKKNPLSYRFLAGLVLILAVASLVAVVVALLFGGRMLYGYKRGKKNGE